MDRKEGRKIQEFEKWAGEKGLKLEVGKEGYDSAVTKYWYHSWLRDGKESIEAEWKRREKPQSRGGGKPARECRQKFRR